MTKEGHCEVESRALSALIDTKPLMNLVKKRGMKMIFVAFDDLWLYHYHQQQYDGVVKDIFQIISLMQESQWEIVGLGGFLSKVE